MEFYCLINCFIKLQISILIFPPKTFWSFIDSLIINQSDDAKSILVMRSRIPVFIILPNVSHEVMRKSYYLKNR